MAFMVSSFTARTHTHQIFVDIFFDEFYTSRMKNPKDWGGDSQSPYTVPIAVQYRISPISAKKHGSHVCKFNTVFLPLRFL